MEIDFSGIGVMAQWYADELFGVFVLYEGPEILKRIRFSNCSDAHKSVVKFVVAYRAKDHKKLQAETDITSSSGKTKE